MGGSRSTVPTDKKRRGKALHKFEVETGDAQTCRRQPNNKVTVEPKIIVEKTPRAVSYKEPISQARVAIIHVDHPEVKLADEDMCSIRNALKSKVKLAVEKRPYIQ